MKINLITPSLFITSKNNSIEFKAIPINFIDKVEFSKETSLNSGLGKLQEINKAEYESLTEVEKASLRKRLEELKDTNIKKHYKEEVKLHHFAAEAIKTVFDKEYGEGNYVVITVGRSLSSIGKMLAMKIGEENVKTSQ